MRSIKTANDILDVLSDGKRHTIAEIADKIEVSYSTVQRYLAELADSYPITITTGGRDYAGVQLQSISCSLYTILTRDELMLLRKTLDYLPEGKEKDALKIKIDTYAKFTNKQS